MPIELAEHVCNQLPKVRQINEYLRDDIVSQWWMVERMLKYYTLWFGRNYGYEILLDDLNLMNESDYTDIHDAWYATNKEQRTEYYYQVMI